MNESAQSHEGDRTLIKTRACQLAILLIASVLSFSVRADDSGDWSWISQSVGKSSSTLFVDSRWKELVRKQLPPAKLSLGTSKGRAPIADSVLALLSGPSDEVVTDKGLVRISACRLHSCTEKAAVLFDVPSHRVTFALVHYVFDQSSGEEPMLLVASNAPTLEPGHTAVVEAWLAEKGLKPTIRRYLRPSGQVVNLDAPAKETLESMFGFNWLKPSTAKCEPFKSLPIKDPATCWRDEGSFGLPVAGKEYRCETSSKNAFLMYSSQKICQEHLETMQANAP
jgi:hypothetical protein